MSAIPSCSICWDKFTPNSALESTKCGHLFHGECIRRWLESNSTCPECRQFGPFLYRVYLNFNNDIKYEKFASLQKTPFATQQEIENLVLKLSLEEEKCKTAEKRLQESEKKQREYIEFIKEIEQKQEKLLKSYQNKIKKLESLFKKERQRRRAAENAEETLVDGLNSISMCLFENFVK